MTQMSPAEAALANLLQELVRDDDRARAFGDGIVHGNDPKGRRLEETAGLAVDLEIASHLLLELGVSATGRSDVVVPLLRGQLADRVQEQIASFFLDGWHEE